MGKLALAAVAAVLVGAPLQATTFVFTFTSSGGDVGSGTFAASGAGNTFTVTGISGIVDGDAITGLSGFAGADQGLFFGGSSHFSFGGLSFSSTGGTAYNFTSYPDGFDHITNSVIDPEGDGNPTPYTLDIAITAVPEPAVWSLMLVGFGAVGYAMRGNRKVAVRFF